MAELDPRIIRNLQRLQAANAPPGDVATYLQSEGVSLPQPSVGEDVAKSAGIGVVKGGINLAGLPGDVSEYGARGLDMATRYIGGKLGYDIPERPPQEPFGGNAQIRRGVEGVTGPLYEPQTTAGQYAQTVGEFAPGLAGGGGLPRLAARAATNVLAPAVASETAGQFTKGTAAEGPARIAAALLGSLAPSAAMRAITPLPTDAARMNAVNTLRNEGVTDLTAGQMTGRKPLQYLEAERGRGAGLQESQADQFTAAALSKAGINANRATPEVIDQAFTRIGDQFDNLAARNTARLDTQFATDLRNAEGEYNSLVSAPNRAPAVANFREEIANAVRQHGDLPGDVYQSLRSRMERTARNMRNNPEAQNAIRDMRSALDDAMERSIAQSGNPNDLAAWQQARNEYRNMLVIEKAATAAGENAALGLISPAALRNATVAMNRRGYARGQGDFADLARSGVAVMSPLPNSGTAGRTAAQNLGAGTAAAVGSMIGGGGGFAAGGPFGAGIGTAVGAAAGATAPRLVGRAATSAIGRSYLANQLATPIIENLRPGQAAIAAPALAAINQPSVADLLQNKKRSDVTKLLLELAARKGSVADLLSAGR